MSRMKIAKRVMSRMKIAKRDMNGFKIARRAASRFKIDKIDVSRLKIAERDMSRLEIAKMYGLVIKKLIRRGMIDWLLLNEQYFSYIQDENKFNNTKSR